MHVAFFNRSYYPDQTATGQLLTDLCEDLVREHQCRVTVIAGFPLATADGSPATGLADRETRNGVEVRRARGTRFPKRGMAGRVVNYLTYFVSACWTGLRITRPDAIVAMTDPPIIGLAAYLSSKRFGAPLVMAFNDLFPEVTVILPGYRSPAIDAVLQRVNEFLVRRAALNITLGETMRARLIEGKGAPPDRTVIIPSWADTQSIVPGPRENGFRRAHGLSGRFVVMHSGNIGLAQGLESIIDAAALLRHVSDIQFVFQGDGVTRPELERRVREKALPNVMFLPFQPRERLSESFAAADVFLVSLQQGLAGYIVPSKLYGILAAGRPYVAAVEPACEVAVITQKYECGLLAEPGNARSIADAVLVFHTDRDRASECGSRARGAAAGFDRRLQVGRYADALRAVSRRHAPAASRVIQRSA